MVRLGIGDPGKQKSKFGILALDVLPREVRVLGAKQLQLDYTVVEGAIDAMHQRLNFLRFIVELNNTGQHVVDSMRRYHPRVPLWPITTVGRALTSDEKIQGMQTMHKQGAAEYVKRLKDAGVLKFPLQSTPELEELKRQMEGFLPHVTEAGHMSYFTEGNQPDDLVMCLIMGCFVGQNFMEGDLAPMVLSQSADSNFWASVKSDNEKAYDNFAEKKLNQIKIPGFKITGVDINGEQMI